MESGEWTAEKRETFLQDKFWRSGEPGNYVWEQRRPEFDAHDCQELRRRLVEMGYYFILSNSHSLSEGKKFNFKVYFFDEGTWEAADESENRAVTIAACRALIARGEE